MTGVIFVIQNNQLVELKEKPPASEDIFQSLLAEHPGLLAGEQMNAEVPRRWLLISREMGIPGEDAGSARWALDHLFLDQDGVPTLVGAGGGPGLADFCTNAAHSLRLAARSW